mmetsp:Transcript_11816/g.24090  ORF Transcript_11816/g.24090 Transcript_11816/m.24090 type:complete len:231 (+) Transcript_11816:41-733(+)
MSMAGGANRVRVLSESVRQSGRKRKLTEPLRVLDDVARREIEVQRLGALEEDNHAEDFGGGEDEDYNPLKDEDETLQQAPQPHNHGRRKVGATGAGGGGTTAGALASTTTTANATMRMASFSSRGRKARAAAVAATAATMASSGFGKNAGVRRFNRSILDILEQDDPEAYPPGVASYGDLSSAPSAKPRRKLCSICGFEGPYACVRCGWRFCSRRCGGLHEETRCLKWTM